MTRPSILDTSFAFLSIAGATVGTWLIDHALGFMVGMGGLFVQFYFNARKDKREERELALKEKEFERDRNADRNPDNKTSTG